MLGMNSTLFRDLLSCMEQDERERWIDVGTRGRIHVRTLQQDGYSGHQALRLAAAILRELQERNKWDDL